jgi:hypothetical protein
LSSLLFINNTGILTKVSVSSSNANYSEPLSELNKLSADRDSLYQFLLPRRAIMFEGLFDRLFDQINTIGWNRQKAKGEIRNWAIIEDKITGTKHVGPHTEPISTTPVYFHPTNSYILTASGSKYTIGDPAEVCKDSARPNLEAVCIKNYQLHIQKSQSAD